MRIAFYAPMKPPDHPLPSGDRTMARMLIAALEAAGHRVDVASRFRSWDGSGDPLRQSRLADLGTRFADRLLRRWRAHPSDAPELWFTYHLYHKAPDWLGPPIAGGLGIPYVVAEASFAAKQAHGPWAEGHRAAARAIATADRVITLNPTDVDGIRPLLAEPGRLVPLPPFVDRRPFAAARTRREVHRAALAGGCGAGADEPLLLACGMMRPGAKLASYRLLGQALQPLRHRRWRLAIAGDGPAEAHVHEALAGIGARCRWLGRLIESDLAAAYAACDLLVWPAIGEAWGMALLEAQAAGLPVVAGRNGGVAGVVEDGETGLLTPPGEAAAFAAAVAALLDDPPRRLRMANAAASRVERVHDLPVASRVLDAALCPLVGDGKGVSRSAEGRSRCMAG